MKKALSVFMMIITLVVLIACTKQKYKAEFKVDVENNGTNFVITLEVIDPEDEVNGDIIIALTDVEEDKEVNNTKTSKEDLEARKEDADKDNFFTYSGLTMGKKYRLDIKTTIDEKMVNVYSKVIESTPRDNEEISTVEEFLSIKTKRNANYKLMNDLDFAGREDDIASNIITLFSGTFDGQGFTIRNFKLESSSINVGIFQQLSTDAKVHDLKLDNIHMGMKEGQKATGSKRVGILFGQNTSRSAEVKNITITNSTIDIKLNGNADYQEIGFLGGASVAKMSGINIDNTNVINVESERIGKLKIGGLVGKIDNTSQEDVEVNDVILEGTINYKISQTNKVGVEKQLSLVNIGGLAGQGNLLTIKNAIIKTDINVDESRIVLNKEEEDAKKDAQVTINVAGVIAQSANVNLKDVIFEGNIDIKEILLHIKDEVEDSKPEETPNPEVRAEEDKEDEKEEDKLKRSIKLNINVGGIYTTTQSSNLKFVNVLRTGGEVSVFESTNQKIITNTGTLFSNARNIKYQENNTFGITSDVVTDNPDIKVFTVEELFKLNDWILQNYKK